VGRMPRCRSDSRPLSRFLPRLLLFSYHRATPGADVIENLFVEQHKKKALTHRHGAFAGRAEELACLQVLEILLLVRPHHRNRKPSTMSCVSHNHFAEVLSRRQCSKRFRTPAEVTSGNVDDYYAAIQTALKTILSFQIRKTRSVWPMLGSSTKIAAILPLQASAPPKSFSKPSLTTLVWPVLHMP
jgi:hypothetical protein